MRVGILALQGDVTEHLRALCDLGVESRLVRRSADLGAVDGIVIPGGESTTMSMLLDSSGLTEPLAKELDAGMPAFGTCAGMILLASQITDGRDDQHCFGAIDISVRRNGYGRQTESFECTLSVPALRDRLGPVDGDPMHAVFIRAPVVESVGPEVEVLAVLGDLEGSEPSPVLCRQGKVVAAAFHPELTADLRLHELFVSMIDRGE